MEIALTPKQRNKLIEISEQPLLRKGDEEDIDLIYELVRKDLVNNLVIFAIGADWKFKITELGEAFLEE